MTDAAATLDCPTCGYANPRDEKLVCAECGQPLHADRQWYGMTWWKHAHAAYAVPIYLLIAGMFVVIALFLQGLHWHPEPQVFVVGMSVLFTLVGLYGNVLWAVFPLAVSLACVLMLACLSGTWFMGPHLAINAFVLVMAPTIGGVIYGRLLRWAALWVWKRSMKHQN